MNDTAILLVGHGSRNREGNKEILHFAAQWRERHPDWHIETCFIEHAEVLHQQFADSELVMDDHLDTALFHFNAAGGNNRFGNRPRFTDGKSQPLQKLG